MVRGGWTLGALAGIALVTLTLGTASSGCRRGDPVQRLFIRGAPSMDGAISALSRAFASWHPDIEVIADCVCPPCVVYEGGAPETQYDIWAAWGEWELERLAQAGNLRFSRTVAAGATPLALAVATNASGSVRGFEDLASDAVGAIGVGDPGVVASGHHARQHLTEVGLWPRIEDRLVFSRSGCELLKWLGLGREVDVAIVLGACVTEDPTSVRLVRELPDEACPPIPLLFAITEDAPNAQAADLFVQFLSTPEARDTLARKGIDPERAP